MREQSWTRLERQSWSRAREGPLETVVPHLLVHSALLCPLWGLSGERAASRLVGWMIPPPVGAVHTA